MPRSKRPLDEVDGIVNKPAQKVGRSTRTSNSNESAPTDQENVQPTAATKEQAVVEATDGGNQEDELAVENNEEEDDDVASISSTFLPGETVETYKESPFDYVRVPRPYWDYEAENYESEEALESEDLHDQFTKDIEGFEHNRRAILQPDHKWVMMRDGWALLQKSLKDIEKRCPDNFGMYIYNDFEGYGMLEVIENLLNIYSTAFNRTVTKKKSDEAIQQTHKEMWLTIGTLGHLLNWADMTPLVMVDDGERFVATADLMRLAILSALNTLDRAGHLKEGSEFKDIGIVIGAWYSALKAFSDIDSSERHKSVLGYAAKGDIDVSAVFGMTAAVQESADSGEHEALPANPSLDYWKFAKHFKEHKEEYGQERSILAGPKALGGEYFDITAMSSEERAEHAFDKKNPMLEH